MNNRVRTYLIDKAKSSNEFVYYSDVVKDCELDFDLSTKSGKNKLSKVLGDVSEFENSFGRPLISSIVIYKDEKKNDHGDGFYKVAVKLGKGNFKQLKDNLYGFEEAKKSQIFWKNETHFKDYYEINTEHKNDLTPFFNKAEIDFFKAWGGKPYDPNKIEDYNAKEFIMKSVWAKSVNLGEKLVALNPGFILEGKKMWSQRGWTERNGQNVPAAIFKSYTWVKIFRDTDKQRDIFFTFGVDVENEAFIYKIDCQRTRDSKLSMDQIEICNSLTPDSAKWNEIDFGELLKLNEENLIRICNNFITTHIEYYDAVVDAIWGKSPLPAVFKNRLLRRGKPNGKFSDFPNKIKRFEEVDIDYLQQSKVNKDLGDAGEELVKLHEIDCLTRNEQHEDAANVKIVKDGRGYDVLSYDKLGSPKYIEVKTTTGDKLSMFYLSDNELEFMKQNSGSYSIYRVYNYDVENNFGEFFELNGDVEAQILMKPKTFSVLLKQSQFP